MPLYMMNLFIAGGQSSSSSSSKKDSDLQPLKSGTLADLDEEMDRTEDSNQTGKVPGSESTNAVFLRAKLEEPRYKIHSDVLNVIFCRAGNAVERRRTRR